MRSLTPTEVIRSHAEKARKYGETYNLLMAARMKGHFRYSDGTHGPFYYSSYRMLKDPQTTTRLAQDLVDILPSKIQKETEVVVGPVTWGLVLAPPVALMLSNRRSLKENTTVAVAPIHPDSNGGLCIRPECVQDLQNKNVLLVDSICNLGRTLDRCRELVTQSGGTVVGSAVLLKLGDRSNASDYHMMQFDMLQTYPAESCAHCRIDIPLTIF